MMIGRQGSTGIEIFLQKYLHKVQMGYLYHLHFGMSTCTLVDTCMVVHVIVIFCMNSTTYCLNLKYNMDTGVKNRVTGCYKCMLMTSNTIEKKDQPHHQNHHQHHHQHHQHVNCYMY